VGGYPEWLTLTGDDTYFALELKRKCPHWAFVPEAVVFWHAPETLLGFWRKLSSWSKGDGESGIYSQRYFLFTLITVSISFLSLLMCASLLMIFLSKQHVIATTLFVLSSVILFFLVFSFSARNKVLPGSMRRFIGRLVRSIGFIQGVKQRPQVTLQRYSEVEGVVFVLSGVPIDDTGGGSRGAQIARQFLERNFLVVYLYKFQKDEHRDLQLPIWNPGLVHAAVSDMDWKAFRWQYEEVLESKQILALIEFPLKEFVPIIGHIHRYGGEVVYDVIDDWESSLGGSWYSASIEQKIIDQADMLVATAQPLAENLQSKCKRKVELVPNAVNLTVFNRQKRYERPSDLPDADLKLIYIGALWGEWFDWQLLQRIAEEFPNAAITVIGDYDGQVGTRSQNLHFLGLREQESLPAYLAHSDVAIIPWKILPLTQATSPLKVYEYLAMGLPVVAPEIEPLAEMPYVYCVSSDDEFVEAIQKARDIRIDVDELDEFAFKNSWMARIDWLIERTNLA
jgi:glycosyltransferase involved in cell wall biosynthesis